MKTPTRILVGRPEVTSAFVLMGLVLGADGDGEVVDSGAGGAAQ